MFFRNQSTSNDAAEPGEDAVLQTRRGDAEEPLCGGKLGGIVCQTQSEDEFFHTEDSAAATSSSTRSFSFIILPLLPTDFRAARKRRDCGIFALIEFRAAVTGGRPGPPAAAAPTMSFGNLRAARPLSRRRTRSLGPAVGAWHGQCHGDKDELVRRTSSERCYSTTVCSSSGCIGVDRLR